MLALGLQSLQHPAIGPRRFVWLTEGSPIWLRETWDFYVESYININNKPSEFEDCWGVRGRSDLRKATSRCISFEVSASKLTREIDPVTTRGRGR